MKNNFKFLAIIIILVVIVLIVSVEIKYRVETISKGAGQEKIKTEETINFNNIDSEVGPTLTEEQAKEAIEQNKESGGFHDFMDPEDL